MNEAAHATWRRRAETRRKKRRSLDLSLELVAERIGVSAPTVHRWERGAIKPHSDLAQKWDDALFVEAK
jgi:transcriptional regulator with XRE-family HTH domain